VRRCVHLEVHVFPTWDGRIVEPRGDSFDAVGGVANVNYGRVGKAADVDVIGKFQITGELGGGGKVRTVDVNAGNSQCCGRPKHHDLGTLGVDCLRIAYKASYIECPIATRWPTRAGRP